MAITGLHYRLFKELHAAGLLPQGGSLLQLGQANWYGDISTAQLQEDAVLLDRRDVIQELIDINHAGHVPSFWFDIADAFWRLWLNPIRSVAIDFNGREDALQQDLNQIVNLPEQFETVINGGTAEHIFNICQVFSTMHYRCKPGGLMIHDCPFTGWVDHGFYNLNPTLFWDLAAANHYEVIRIAVGDIKSHEVIIIESREQVHELAKRRQLPENSELFVVLRKTEDAPFTIPHQGIYNGALSTEAKEAWATLR